MYTTLIVLIIIAAILLTLVVLVQNSKGGGLAAGFQSSNQFMGVRKTTDFIEKATWGLAIFMVVLSILAVGVRSSALFQPDKNQLSKANQQISAVRFKKEQQCLISVKFRKL